MSTTKHWRGVGQNTLCGMVSAPGWMITDDPEKLGCGECFVRLGRQRPAPADLAQALIDVLAVYDAETTRVGSDHPKVAEARKLAAKIPPGWLKP